MIKAVQLPLAIDRGAPRIYTLKIVGVDLTGAAWAGSIRLQPDSDASIVDLLPTTDATAAGARLLQTGLDDDGVTPVSWLRIQIPAMATGGDAGEMPAAAELGQALALYWDFFIAPVGQTASRLLFGTVTVNPTATKPAMAFPLENDPLSADVIVRIGVGITTIDVSAASLLAILSKQANDAATQTAADRVQTAADVVSTSGYASAAAAIAKAFPDFASGVAGTAAGDYFSVLDGTGEWINIYRNGTSPDADHPLIQLPGKAAYAGSGGAGLIGLQQAFSGAVTDTVLRKLGEFVSVKDFGAKGDYQPLWVSGAATGPGTGTDDSAAINAALSSGASTVYFPGPANYYVKAESIKILDCVKIIADKHAMIYVDDDLLVGVEVGSSSSIFGGQVHGLRIAKDRNSAFDADAEDYGYVFLNCTQSSYYDIEARWFKYPVHFKSLDGTRCAYSTFVNLQAIGGYRNLTRESAGSGFTNELLFLGGRCYAIAGTDTNVYWDGGNHCRFFGMSLEGTGQQAVYENGNSNMYDSCRTENGGGWEVDAYVIGPGAGYTNIRAWDLYGTVTNGGTNSLVDSQKGMFREIGFGNTPVAQFRRNGSSADATKPALLVEDLGSSSNSYGLLSRISRTTGYHWRAERSSDGLEIGQLDALGNFYAARSFQQGQSSWNLGANIRGTYYDWIDAWGMKRQKAAAAPTAANDGFPLGMKVGVPASATAAGAPGQWSTDSGFTYFYTGDGTTHAWRRVATAVW